MLRLLLRLERVLELLLLETDRLTAVPRRGSGPRESNSSISGAPLTMTASKLVEAAKTQQTAPRIRKDDIARSQIYKGSQPAPPHARQPKLRGRRM